MFGSALRRLREQTGLSREAFAQACGLSQSAVISYENNRRKPDFEAILKIERLFQTSIACMVDEAKFDSQLAMVRSLSPDEEALLTLYSNAEASSKRIATYALKQGQPKRLRKPYHQEFSDDLSSLSGKAHAVTIPVVGKAAAGLPIEMIRENEDSLAVYDDIIQAGDFAVIASGDSMIDAGIHDGDRVIIRPQPSVENGEIALVAIEDGSTIKRFYREPDGCRLEPANPRHHTQKYPRSVEVRVLGKFIRVAD